MRRACSHSQCHSVARPTDSSLSKAIEGKVKLYSTNNLKAANAQQSQSEFVSHNREDPMTAPQWPILNQSGHIFNHKGGLHIPNTVPQQQPQLPMQPPAFQVPPYNLQPQQTQDGYMKVAPMENTRPLWQQMPQFPLEQLQTGNVQQNGPYNWPILSPNIPVYNNPPINNNNEETLPKQDMVQTYEDTAVADKKKNGKNTIASKSEAASTSAEEKDSEYDDEEEVKPTEPPPKKKVHKHKKVLKTPPSGAAVAPDNSGAEKKPIKKVEDSAPQQLKIVHSKLQMEFLDHDGDSEKPSGAVLSLTLGLSISNVFFGILVLIDPSTWVPSATGTLITIAMIVLVGCRATVVRKRIRRGGKAPYSHDADFLVNGMYL